MGHRRFCRVAMWVLPSVGFLASCGSDFSATGTGDGGYAAAGGAGTGGSKSTGGRASGGARATGGQPGSGGLRATGGVPTTGGFPATGGVNATGGSGGTVASGGAVATGGTSGSGGASTCGSLTVLSFVDGDFESADPVDTPPGWEGAPNPPYYAALSAAAARTGSQGVEFNDTGTGTPGIEQKIAVPATAIGKTVSVTAWIRLVTFPSMRLLVEANLLTGVHLAVPFSDTDPAKPGFQQLSVSLTIPPTTDHLMIMLIAAAATGDGIAYADDVQVCVDGRCSPCAAP